MNISPTYKTAAVKIIFTVMIACISLMSCDSSGKTPPVITVTIQPQKYFLEKIVGDKFDVVCLLSQGSNPEAYEPSLNHLMNLEKSRAYFCMGNLGFELAILDKVHNNTPDLKIFNNSENIEMLYGTHEPTAVSRHSHEVDPHVWTSVRNAKVIAKNMYDAVLELDKHHHKYYRTNYESLVAELDSLDAEIAHKLAPVKGLTFAIWHPSLSYFARDYGLHQVSLENEGKEISASLFKKEIDKAKAAGVKIFFYQKEFDGRQVETVNRQLESKLIQINPMNYNWSEEMLQIANALSTK